MTIAFSKLYRTCRGRPSDVKTERVKSKKYKMISEIAETFKVLRSSKLFQYYHTLTLSHASRMQARCTVSHVSVDRTLLPVSGRLFMQLCIH